MTRNRSICVVCGSELVGPFALCAYHMTTGDKWAESNRVMCDLIHRGVVPERLPEEARAEEPWVVSAETA